MDAKFLDLKPKRFLCPYCGEWHDWGLSHELGYYDSSYYNAEFGCENQLSGFNHRETQFIFHNGYCYYKTIPTCSRGNLDIDNKIPVKNIVESNEEPRVTFSVPFVASNDVDSIVCNDCKSKNICLMYKLGNENYSRNMQITFGFEFDQSEYDQIHNKPEQVSEQPQVEEKEESTMKKETIWQRLYEHSPKENVEIVKNCATKYKPTLKWAVPVVTIYTAYRILNKKDAALTINNVDRECQKKLGFSLDALKDKKSLSQLMVIGGSCAAAYAAIKCISSIYSDNLEEIQPTDIEEGMSQLEKLSNKFKWIQPKTEQLLPVAVSIIIVYLMTQKPAWFENIKSKAEAIFGGASVKLSTYAEMAELFVADKFNINISNEKDAKKLRLFMLLAAVTGIGLFLFGKSKDISDANKENFKSFMKQLLSIMKKLMPTMFAGTATFLITKQFIGDDMEDLLFDEEDDVVSEQEAEPEKAEEVEAETDKDDSSSNETDETPDTK